MRAHYARDHSTPVQPHLPTSRIPKTVPPNTHLPRLSPCGLSLATPTGGWLQTEGPENTGSSAFSVCCHSGKACNQWAMKIPLVCKKSADTAEPKPGSGAAQGVTGSARQRGRNGLH